MPRLIARANGNFTDSTTWATVSSTLDSESANQTLTTSWIESQSFTPGAITIDAILVKVSHRISTTASGTMSVRLAQAGNTVPGTEITINVSDIPAVTTTGRVIGWYCFKFAEPVTLQAATAYTVSARTSTASQIALFRDGTSGNWSRMLRTTTSQAPAAGDDFVIVGEWTAPGTVTVRTVTMNNQTTTSYAYLDVGGYGRLTYATGSGLTLRLFLDSADSHVRFNGEINVGTASNPIPVSSTAVLGWNSPATIRTFNFYAGSTLRLYGSPRTAGNETVACFLTQNASAGQTTIYVDRATGWLSGDSITISGTSRGSAGAETVTLTQNAGSNSLTFTPALYYNHLCTGDHKCEIILRTRNVTFINNSTYVCNIYVHGTLECVFAAFSAYSGSILLLRSGSISTFSKAHFALIGVQTESGASSMTLTDSTMRGLRICQIAHGTININNFSIISGSSNSFAFGSTDGTGSITIDGLRYYNAGAVHSLQLVVPYSNMIVKNVETRYGPEGYRLLLINLKGGTLTGENFMIYDGGELTGHTVSIDGSGVLNIDGFYVRGHGYYFLGLTGASEGLAVIRLKNATFKPISGNTHRYAIYGTGNAPWDIEIHGMTIDESSAAFTHGHIYLTNISPVRFYIVNPSGLDLAKCDLSLIPVLVGDNSSLMIDGSTLAATVTSSGILRADSVIRRGTVGFSQRLSPRSATRKIRSGIKRVPVNAGSNIKINVYVRESVTADGQDYNGNRPRLVLKRNPFAGILSDTVLATATAACEGAWEKLTGTTQTISVSTILEFFVDCDGTAGWVNVDEWSVGD